MASKNLSNTYGKNHSSVKKHLGQYYIEATSKMDEFCGRIICVLNERAKSKIRESRNIPCEVDFDVAVVRNCKLRTKSKVAGNVTGKVKKNFSIEKRKDTRPLRYTLYKIVNGTAEIIENPNGEKFFESKRSAYFCGKKENVYLAEKHMATHQENQDLNV